MEVAISTLRAELAKWVQRARAGEEVVITDRGIPVVRLVPVDQAPLLEELTRRGVLSKPQMARPSARKTLRVRATGPVSDLVRDQHR